MVFRGVYRDGVIVPSPGVELPEGTMVRWTPDAQPGRTRRAKARPQKAAPKVQRRKRMTKAERVAAVMQAFGMWRDRPEWKGKSSVHIAAELRKRALGDRFRG